MRCYSGAIAHTWPEICWIIQPLRTSRQPVRLRGSHLPIHSVLSGPVPSAEADNWCRCHWPRPAGRTPYQIGRLLRRPRWGWRRARARKRPNVATNRPHSRPQPPTRPPRTNTPPPAIPHRPLNAILLPAPGQLTRWQATKHLGIDAARSIRSPQDRLPHVQRVVPLTRATFGLPNHNRLPADGL